MINQNKGRAPLPVIPAEDVESIGGWTEALTRYVNDWQAEDVSTEDTLTPEAEFMQAIWEFMAEYRRLYLGEDLETRGYTCDRCGANVSTPASDCCDECLLKFYFDLIDARPLSRYQRKGANNA